MMAKENKKLAKRVKRVKELIKETEELKKELEKEGIKVENPTDNTFYFSILIDSLRSIRSLLYVVLGTVIGFGVAILA
jgi:hypothetical protein